MNNNTHKREYRQLNPETKAKIGNAVRGKSKSPSHKAKISQAMTEYWKTIPSRPAVDDSGQKHTTMDDLIGATASNDHLSK